MRRGFGLRYPIDRDLSVADDDEHVLQMDHVVERIAIHDDEVRFEAFLDGAGAAGEAEHLDGEARGRADRVERLQARVHEADPGLNHG